MFRKRIIKLTAAAVILVLSAGMLAGCSGNSGSASGQGSGNTPSGSSSAMSKDEIAASLVSGMIDGIKVTEWEEGMDEMCAATKTAWDALTDAQKKLVDDPDYFGLETGDASQDDPLNADGIGEKEILVVSFGTAYNQSRTMDIGSVERSIQEIFPDWSVRRAFSSQSVINHILARDGEKIDNLDQALERAVDNGVKQLVIQPTYFIGGEEYLMLENKLYEYGENFEVTAIGAPLFGTGEETSSTYNSDIDTALRNVLNYSLSELGGAEQAALDGTALVLVGEENTADGAVYRQLQGYLATTGLQNIFIGTITGAPEDTAIDAVISKVKEAGYTNVILAPFMLTAGETASLLMGDEENPYSWVSRFKAGGSFTDVRCDFRGLGRIPEIAGLFALHAQLAIQGMQY